MNPAAPEGYVQAFEPLPTPHTVGERRQISRDGAWLVRWRPDGREIFYLGLDNWLHALPVEAPLQFGQSARSSRSRAHRNTTPPVTSSST